MLNTERNSKNTLYLEYMNKLRIILRYYELLEYISEHCNEYSVSKMLLCYCSNQLKYTVKLKIINNLIKSGYLKQYKKSVYKGNRPTFVAKTQFGIDFFDKNHIEFEKLKKDIDKAYMKVNKVWCQ
jgi:hypothetical protein